MMNYKKAFTLSYKSFRSNPLLALLCSRIARFSQTKFRFAHSYGFTLAETLIVLTILGVIAAITVPSVVKRHMEAIDRTKLKKAMSIYDYSIQKMTVENDLKSDTALKNWSEEKENCGNTTVYFKKSSGDGCEFKTADNVYWDIKDIMNPVVALSKDAMDKYKSTRETDGNKSFKFVTSYDPNTGAFRSNDLKYEEQLALETGDEEALEELEKVWGAVNIDKKEINASRACSDNTKNSSNKYYSCTKYDNYVNSYTPVEIQYDTEGNITKQIFCENEECDSYSINYYEADFPHEYAKNTGDETEYRIIANRHGDKCSKKDDWNSCERYYITVIDKDNPENMYFLMGCDPNGNADNCRYCTGGKNNMCPDKYEDPFKDLFN